MKFHIIVEANNSHLEIARLAQLAESYGMAGIWTSSMHDSRDPFINFTEAARVTLNEISGGRAPIGVGAGDGGTATASG